MTRNEILTAARVEFARGGFQAANLRQIADRVGIKVPSLYAHFASKEDIYLTVYAAITDEHTNFIDELVASTGSHSPASRLEALLYGVALYYREHPDNTVFSLRAAIEEAAPGGERLRKLFLDSESSLVVAITNAHREGVASGSFRPGDSDAFTALFLALMDGVFLQLTHYEPLVFAKRLDLVWQQLSMLLLINGEGAQDDA